MHYFGDGFFFLQGLKKLIEATLSVNELSKVLVEKEKELAVANAKAEEVLKSVTVQQQAAEKVKMQVQKVKDKAQVIVDQIAVRIFSKSSLVDLILDGSYII